VAVYSVAVRYQSVVQIIQRRPKNVHHESSLLLVQTSPEGNRNGELPLRDEIRRTPGATQALSRRTTIQVAGSLRGAQSIVNCSQAALFHARMHGNRGLVYMPVIISV
jgi:hypothetical protein